MSFGDLFTAYLILLGSIAHCVLVYFAAMVVFDGLSDFIAALWRSLK